MVAALLALLPLLWLAAPGAARAQTSLALQLPSSLAYDAQGNLYFAERAAHTVRKLAADGTLTVVAGTGTQGFAGDNGPATAAELDSPQGLALDSDGNLYIADTNNHRIRRVAAGTGVITTVAGMGQAGFSGDNGPATTARLNGPTALATDASGNLLVADTRNHRIRRVAVATGTITTLAGNGAQGFAGDGGPAAQAEIDSPAGLALDAGGNVYLADTRNQRVRRVDAAVGTISTVAGFPASRPGLPVAAGDGGPANAATLALPRGLAVDGAGNLFIADSANQRIRRVAADGTITTVAGDGTQGYAGDNGTPSAAHLDSPRAVAISPSGSLTLADSSNSRLRAVSALTSSTPQIATVVGPGARLSTGVLTLTSPVGLIYGAGSVTATLSGGAGATGPVTFVDSGSGVAAPLGNATLNQGVATLDTSGLAAGAHTLTATYSGDGTHAAAQSQAISVNIAPLTITASCQPAPVVYGQLLPALTGALQGVLPQDAGRVSAVFSSFASSFAGGLTPAGLYPVSATLTGAAAGDYSLASTSGTLTVNKAPVTVVVASSVSSPAAGTPVTLTVQVAGALGGVPTGSVTLVDGSSVVAQLALSGGAAQFTATNLGAGAHSFAAFYVGDVNFLPASSSSSALMVGSAQDFMFAATGAASQSIASGSAAAYTFAINTQGAQLASPITLAVSGVPAGATASLNPAYLPPGGAATSFTMTVQTTKTLAANGAEQATPTSGAGLACALFAPIFLAGGRFRSRRGGRRRFPHLFIEKRVVLAVLACITSATLASGCATRVNSASEAQTAQTYTLTVTGTATSATGTVLQHSVNVTLQVL